ncbi:MAG: SDR family NAD(P)-dependent oxidoreductase, partial [Prolixibacteraceae bacterium]|nr:SDR family NAD(P)-dependent oxidoreductase [Prolixibacteraceae bacterium]
MKELEQLIEISQYYGKQKSYVIAGGGNTSWKDGDRLFIKASGVSLSTIDEGGFCILDRKKLHGISKMQFSADAVEREEQVKNALLNSRLNPESGLRPSVETSLHNLFEYAFVVHTHPSLVNALMCSANAEAGTKNLFGDKALFIPYTDPGFVLFTVISEKIDNFIKLHGEYPKMVFIQNHGIFVAADTMDEIRAIYADIESILKQRIGEMSDVSPLPLSEKFLAAVPAIRMILSGEDQVKTARVFNNPLVAHFLLSRAAFAPVSAPFTPDQIVYCQSEYLYIENTESSDAIVEEVRRKSDEYSHRRGAKPKLIFVEKEGVVVADTTVQALEYLYDLTLDFSQIALYSGKFGGPHPMLPQQTAFIENWEVENYRKKVSLGGKSQRRLENKIAVITGAAQGFGAGIAEMMFNEGANIIIADVNEEKGKEFARALNAGSKSNKAMFVMVNVAEPQSVKTMIDKTVESYGGIDVMISNAGILRAGSLDEMTPDTFSLMTQVNYNAYFHCAKYASPVMKIQNSHRLGYFTDIIQINSKSGLKGSNKNFAYAGGKFGGIGLTQSFALELMPFGIKVNSICPGNFFDGPLWADPQNGLFVQYLNAGKIKGAKTVEDVKRHYESQVPAGRGCYASDVVKAIFYVIEQEYETGQAVPVTGEQ